MTWDFSNSI